eukprot:650875_1
MSSGIKNIESWNIKHIESWLNNLSDTDDLTQHVELFRQNELNGALILQMDNTQIQQLLAKLPLRHQIVIKSGLMALKKSYKLNNDPGTITNTSAKEQENKTHNAQSKTNQPWTKSDDRVLLDYLSKSDDGQTFEEICAILKRKPSCIQNRIRKLKSKLIEHYNKQKHKSNDIADSKAGIRVDSVRNENKSDDIKPTTNDDQRRLLELRLWLKKLRYYAQIEENYSLFQEMTSLIANAETQTTVKQTDIYQDDALSSKYGVMFKDLCQKHGKIKINTNTGAFYLDPHTLPSESGLAANHKKRSASDIVIDDERPLKKKKRSENHTSENQSRREIRDSVVWVESGG